MRLSQAFAPTLKEAPAEATQPSHVLLLRAGYVRQVGAGIYELLPLGLRVLRKIERIIRAEMDGAHGQEILLPALLPAEYFKESGRFAPETGVGEILFRFEDRKGGEYHLGPTHEEIITDLMRRELRSYRQLPQLLYQIQSKFRDEPRPRAGLLRCREFLMKDAYSFDASHEAALESYEKMRQAYVRIFTRLGLRFVMVQADAGGMGGSRSAEFQVLAQQGEDSIVACENCDYAANVEVAEVGTSKSGAAASAQTPSPEKIHTPGCGGIDDVVAHLKGGLTAAGMLKCILYRLSFAQNASEKKTHDKTVMVVVRGDREVNEIKLAKFLASHFSGSQASGSQFPTSQGGGFQGARMATPEEVKEATGAALGFAGPVGFEGNIFADLEVPQVLDAVTGANETDHHLRHVSFGRDFNATLADLRSAEDGDTCNACGGTLRSYRAIEGGHIFVLGTHYSEKMGATFLDPNGKAQPVVMGCYGIGVSRILAAAIEQHHDDKGIAWPMSIAPYQVTIIPIGKDDEVQEYASNLYAQLTERGVETLLDDRKERPGVKFADAELVGTPIQLRLGSRSLKEGKAELFFRASGETQEPKVAEVIEHIEDYIRNQA